MLTSDEFKLFKKYYNNLEIVYKISSNEALSWLLPSNVGKDLENKLTEFFHPLLKIINSITFIVNILETILIHLLVQRFS